MGYDMYLAEPDDTVAPDPQELADARNKFYAFLTKRSEVAEDLEAVEALERECKADNDRYEELARQDDRSRGYFRLNIWGMGEARTIMDQLGMLEVSYEYDGFPEPEAFGIDTEGGTSWDEYWDYTEDVDALDDPNEVFDDEVPSNVIAYFTAHAEHLRWHPEEVTGICIHKLGSNDGWLVTPEECEAAVAQYELAMERAHDRATAEAILAEKAPWFGEWVEYLRTASQRGGFRVW